jgi:hypothetical protein
MQVCQYGFGFIFLLSVSHFCTVLLTFSFPVYHLPTRWHINFESFISKHPVKQINSRASFQKYFLKLSQLSFSSSRGSSFFLVNELVSLISGTVHSLEVINVNQGRAHPRTFNA